MEKEKIDLIKEYSKNNIISELKAGSELDWRIKLPQFTCPLFYCSQVSFSELKEAIKEGYVCDICGNRCIGINTVKKAIKEENKLIEKSTIKNIIKTKPVEKKTEMAKELKKRIEESQNIKKIVIDFVAEFPLFYDKAGYFWAWDDKLHYWVMVDETDLLNALDEIGDFEDCYKSKYKADVITALKMEARKKQLVELPPEQVPFLNCIVNLRTGETSKIDNKYFIKNIIPHNYKEGLTEEIPFIDKLVTEWVGNKKQFLYELISYCMTNEYFIEEFFILYANGSNGKSTFLNFLEKIIGSDNITAGDLFSLIGDKFKATKLLNKKVCLSGELPYSSLKCTDKLKKMTGKDKIDAEFKYKNSFDLRNYAKIIFSGNSVPLTYDQSDAFYRRVRLVKFINTFDTNTAIKKDPHILDKISEEEIEHLIVKLIRICKELYERGNFSEELTIAEKKEVYEQVSNPLKPFMNKYMEFKLDGAIPYKEFIENFYDYLQLNKIRLYSAQEIKLFLTRENITTKTKTIKGNSIYCLISYRWKEMEESQKTLNDPQPSSEVTTEEPPLITEEKVRPQCSKCISCPFMQVEGVSLCNNCFMGLKTEGAIFSPRANEWRWKQ